MGTMAGFFRRNGTKVIGYIMAAIGAMAQMDPIFMTALLGKRAWGAIFLAGGVLVAIRGHTNTAAIKDEIRVDEIAKEGVRVDQAVAKILQNQTEEQQK